MNFETTTVRRYASHVELRQDGQTVCLYFNRLTKRQAEVLHSILEDNFSHVYSSAELTRFGWEEQT